VFIWGVCSFGEYVHLGGDFLSQSYKLPLSKFVISHTLYLEQSRYLKIFHFYIRESTLIALTVERSKTTRPAFWNAVVLAQIQLKPGGS